MVTRVLSIIGLLMCWAGVAFAQSYAYVYDPISLIVQPEFSSGVPSECGLVDRSLVLGISGNEVKALRCRDSESAASNGAFAVHGIIPPGTSKVTPYVAFTGYSSTTTGNICGVFNIVAYIDGSKATDGIRVATSSNRFALGVSAKLGPVAYSSQNASYVLSSSSPLTISTYNGSSISAGGCTPSTCGDRYFRAEVILAGCDSLCSEVTGIFACCSTCSNRGKVDVLGLTLKFEP